MAADDLLVEAGEIERDGQGWPVGIQRLRHGLKAGLDHPFRRIRLAGALPGNCKADLPLVRELKHQREGDGLVDSLEHGRINLRRSERNLEYLNLADALAWR